MTGDEFRELALAMEGAIERAHMGHPDFRANGRIFATLQADERSGVVMLSPEEQAVFLGEHPDVFTPAAGAWGRQGCTVIRLAGADRRTVQAAITLAWERVMSKPRRAARPKSSGSPRARRAPRARSS